MAPKRIGEVENYLYAAVGDHRFRRAVLTRYGSRGNRCLLKHPKTLHVFCQMSWRGYFSVLHTDRGNDYPCLYVSTQTPLSVRSGSFLVPEGRHICRQYCRYIFLSSVGTTYVAPGGAYAFLFK